MLGRSGISSPRSKAVDLAGSAGRVREGCECKGLLRAGSMLVGRTVPPSSSIAVPHLCPIPRLVSAT